jgi:chromosome segregation ATPase
MPFTETALKKMKKDELVALVMKMEERQEREMEVLSSALEKLKKEGGWEEARAATFQSGFDAGREELKKENEELKKSNALVLANKGLRNKLDNIFAELDIGEVPEETSYEDHADTACEKVEELKEQLDHREGELYNAEELLEEAEDGLEEIAKCLDLEWNGIRGDTEIESVVSKIEKLKEECDRGWGYLKDKDYECETQREQKEQAWNEIDKLKKQYEDVKEREELEWSFIDESQSVGEYKEYLKEFHHDFLKKTDWLSDSEEE